MKGSQCFWKLGNKVPLRSVHRTCLPIGQSLRGLENYEKGPKLYFPPSLLENKMLLGALIQYLTFQAPHLEILIQWFKVGLGCLCVCQLLPVVFIIYRAEGQGSIFLQGVLCSKCQVGGCQSPPSSFLGSSLPWRNRDDCGHCPLLAPCGAHLCYLTGSRKIASNVLSLVPDSLPDGNYFLLRTRVLGLPISVEIDLRPDKKFRQRLYQGPCCSMGE